MAAAIWYTGTSNAVTTTLNGSITDTDATIALTSATGLQYPGVIVVDRVDANDEETPLAREYISYTGISGNSLTGCDRTGLGGSTAQSHSSGAKVEEVWSVTHWNDFLEAFIAEHGLTGAHSSALVTALKASGAVVTTGTSDVTIVTPKALADAGIVLTASSTTALTNKTATATSNNIAAKSLHSATTVVDVVAATAPTTGQVLTATDATHATWQDAVAPSAAGSIVTSGLDIGPTSDVDSTSASFADQTGLATTLALGANTCTILAWLSQQVTSTNTDTQVAIRVSIGASAGQEGFAKPAAVSTAGEGISAFHRATGQTGNVIVKAEIARQSGSGTVRAFASHGHLMAIAIKE